MTVRAEAPLFHSDRPFLMEVTPVRVFFSYMAGYGFIEPFSAPAEAPQ